MSWIIELQKILTTAGNTSISYDYSLNKANRYLIEVGQFSQEAILNMQKLPGLENTKKYILKITCSLPVVYNGSKYLEIFGKYDANRELSEPYICLQFDKPEEIVNCLTECKFV